MTFPATTHPDSTVLITGASGFVGKLLAEAETARGNRVIGIHHPAENPDIEFESAGIDLRDTKRLEDFISEINVSRVYHLAAISSVRKCQENPALCFDVNVTGTLNLLDVLSRLSRTPKILFASSCEVYGNVDPAKPPVTENYPTIPINIYGLSKLHAEDVCHFYTREHGMLIVITRGFNHTGPAQAQSFVFPHVANTLTRIEKGLEEPTLKMGNLSVRRDFLDVRDVLKAYMSAMDKARGGSVYNVTSGRCISISEGVRMMVEISDLSVNIIQESSRMRSYDIPQLSGDASLIEKDLGWRAEITLEQTFKDLLAYWKAKEGVE